MRRLALSVSLVALSVSLALAQASSSAPVPASTVVSFDWGDFVGRLGSELIPWAVLLVIGVITSLLPAPVRAFLNTQRTAQVEQLLEKALGFAAARLSDSVKGQTLTLDVQNELAANALQYALDHGSKAVLDFAGGQAALPQKLVARMPASPSVNAVLSPPVQVVAEAKV